MATDPTPTPAALAPAPSPGAALVLTDESKHHALRSLFSIEPSNMTELISMSKMYAESELVPKDFQKKPQNIIIAVQMGRSVGLSTMQSILSIAVINGRPTIWGDAIPALLYYHQALDPSFGNGGILERSPDEAWAKQEGECQIMRKGWTTPLVRRFTYAEAEKAGLIKRSQGGEGSRGVGPWITYPGRMLQMRARSWAARDACPDIMKGLIGREEAEDIRDARTGERVSNFAPPKTIIDVGEVQRFTEEAKREGGGAAPRPAGPPRPSAADASDAKVWKGAIDKMTQADTKNPNVKKITIIGKDGTKFSTINKDLTAKAKEFASSGELAQIKYTVSQYGNDVVSIEAAVQPPPDADDPASEREV